MKFLVKKNILILDKLRKMEKIMEMNLENTKKNFNDLKRMIYLIYKNYRDGETQILAISLTYYSLLAVFPFVALVLGITRGFG